MPGVPAELTVDEIVRSIIVFSEADVGRLLLIASRFLASSEFDPEEFYSEACKVAISGGYKCPRENDVRKFIAGIMWDIRNDWIEMQRARAMHGSSSFLSQTGITPTSDRKGDE